jgi:hypothetical protein
MTQYPLFGGNPFFQPATIAGYGEYGNGVHGPVGFDGRRQWARNRADFLTIDGILSTDFADGTVAHDAFAWTSYRAGLIDAQLAAIPEPGTAALLAGGLALVALVARGRSGRR